VQMLYGELCLELVCPQLLLSVDESDPHHQPQTLGRLSAQLCFAGLDFWGRTLVAVLDLPIRHQGSL
jgi:hypothetical protein